MGQSDIHLPTVFVLQLGGTSESIAATSLGLMGHSRIHLAQAFALFGADNKLTPQARAEMQQMPACQGNRTRATEECLLGNAGACTHACLAKWWTNGEWRPGENCEHRDVYRGGEPLFSAHACNSVPGEFLSMLALLRRVERLHVARQLHGLVIILEDDSVALPHWQRDYHSFLRAVPLSSWHLARLHGQNRGWNDDGVPCYRRFGTAALLLHSSNATAVVRKLERMLISNFDVQLDRLERDKELLFATTKPSLFWPIDRANGSTQDAKQSQGLCGGPWQPECERGYLPSRVLFRPVRDTCLSPAELNILRTRAVRACREAIGIAAPADVELAGGTRGNHGNKDTRIAGGTRGGALGAIDHRNRQRLSPSHWLDSLTAGAQPPGIDWQAQLAAGRSDRSMLQASGGWCLERRGGRVVRLPLGQDYFLPQYHVEADALVVGTLAQLLRGEWDGGWRTGPRDGVDGGQASHYYSLTDVGAGVGQFGRALLSLDGKFRYHGYDGAGNIDEMSGGLVQFADFSRPAHLVVSDWVLSLEVGEHVPRQFERAYIENLHVHNCRGVILSWAQPNQPGHGHVNAHSPAYVRDIFQELGYAYDDRLSQAMRKGPGRTWSYHSRPGREPATDPSGKAHWWLRGAGVQVFRKQGGCQRLT